MILTLFHTIYPDFPDLYIFPSNTWFNSKRGKNTILTTNTVLPTKKKRLNPTKSQGSSPMKKEPSNEQRVLQRTERSPMNKELSNEKRDLQRSTNSPTNKVLRRKEFSSGKRDFRRKERSPMTRKFANDKKRSPMNSCLTNLGQIWILWW